VEAVKDSVLTDLGLPDNPDALLARHVRTLDQTYKAVAGRLAANTAVSIGADGKTHVASVTAIEEPPSLIELRKRVQAMMPRVDVSEAILEVLGWCPQFLDSLTSLAGTESHLADLDVTVAACLTGQALNITYTPIAVKGVPALERHRIGYVDHTYLRAENYAAGNPHLVAKQAGIGFAQALGGGLVAAIDGMRFVVPVPSVYARPNRKYLRTQTRDHLAEHDQRSGLRDRVQGRVGHRPRLPARAGCGFRLRRGPQSRRDRDRHRIVFGPRVRTRALAGQGIPACAGRPAGPEAVAHDG